MQELRSESGVAVDWDRLRPVLDAAMLELSERDHEIVVQRFFGGRSFADIGATLRLTEDTARKRAERALDKLHALLGRRGIRSTPISNGMGRRSTLRPGLTCSPGSTREAASCSLAFARFLRSST